MGGLLDTAHAIERGGLVFVVSLVCVVLGWLYYQEKKRNNAVADERIKEAREDTKEITQALMAASSALQGFKESNQALRTALDAMGAKCDALILRGGSHDR